MSLVFNLGKKLNLFSYINIQKKINDVCLQNQRCITSTNTHSNLTQEKLMTFFDDSKNWNENEVKVGRAWIKDELRIKSNEDLHKLWYVLLKEKNMLLTMEHACKEELKLFPNPERIDKVNESMKNLESVVRERNKAYYYLETGESGERPGKLTKNAFGLNIYHRMSQYLIPKFMNTHWKQKHQFNGRGAAVSKFLKFYHEKLYNEKRKKRTRDFNHVVQLISRFPNLDPEAVKKHYPDVDINKAKNHKKAQGHFISE